MSEPNALDRMLGAKDFGPQYFPELFRLLRDSPLIFLMPYHPELVDTEHSLQEGNAMPQFALWSSQDRGRTIPVFTSVACANAGCKTVGAPDNTYVFAEMVGKDLFDLLRRLPEAVAINPACPTSVLHLDGAALTKLADGSILQPEPGEVKQSTANIMDPADYPTDFLQPLFCFLRTRPQVQAAWILRETEQPGAPVSYVFVLQLEGEAPEVERDFRLVARAACPKDAEYGLTLLDRKNKSMMRMAKGSQPFYAAPGYRPPGRRRAA
jgi:hypothetical protein